MRPFRRQFSLHSDRHSIPFLIVVPLEPDRIMGLTQKAIISPTTVREWRQMVESWSPEEREDRERRLVRRIDWHLLPILVGPDLAILRC